MEPEDLERIEEEERARAAVRRKIEKEQAEAKAKEDGEGCLKGCGVVLGLFFILWFGLTVASPGCGSSKKPDVSDYGGLNAAAAFRDGRIEIENRESEPILKVEIEVNETYKHVTDAIPAKTTYRFYPDIFTSSDGTKLDPERIAVKRIAIHAGTSRGMKHWYGSY